LNSPFRFYGLFWTDLDANGASSTVSVVYFDAVIVYYGWTCEFINTL